jgi:hypothetical protein
MVPYPRSSQLDLRQWTMQFFLTNISNGWRATEFVIPSCDQACPRLGARYLQPRILSAQKFMRASPSTWFSPAQPLRRLQQVKQLSV